MKLKVNERGYVSIEDISFCVGKDLAGETITLTEDEFKKIKQIQQQNEKRNENIVIGHVQE